MRLIDDQNSHRTGEKTTIHRPTTHVNFKLSTSFCHVKIPPYPVSGDGRLMNPVGTTAFPGAVAMKFSAFFTFTVFSSAKRCDKLTVSTENV
ncbi:MAG: hypothetical protein LBI59_02305 [Candidatus Accumulibacter sp.]|nr:hypothetical protein [Accumulibacter sp.]